jgi:7-cyano-7-deazaguanine synthase in queuosine biosynthesis
MTRLILFSGGVESTAMLARSAPGDIALTIFDAGEPDPTFDRWGVTGIALALERRLAFGRLDIGKARDRRAFVYQTFALTAGASLWVSKDPSITEVWYGLKKGDPTPNVAEQYHRCMDGWAAMHPGVPFRAPLIDLTEAEQWLQIPAKVRSMVRNCLFGTDCGTCRKCVKLKALPGSFWCD